MKIKIQEPYWGAFKRFGWAKGIWGIGLARKDIYKAIINKERVYIKIYKFKDEFDISPITVRNYALKNKTMYKARYNNWLYVVPSTLLGKYKIKKEEPEFKEEPFVDNRLTELGNQLKF